jgi:hypothetical protein
MPLYSTAKTGSIVIDEEIPAQVVGDHLTCAGCGDEHSEVMDRKHCYRCQRKGIHGHWWNAARDETPATVLPELRGGELLLAKSGRQYRVHLVRKPKRDTGYIEKLFRLENVVIGNQEWTGEELAEQGLRLIE